jgi:hypothetical protein
VPRALEPGDDLKLTSIALALLALAAGLVALGCGDEEEDEPQTLTSGATGATGEDGAAGSKAAFLEAANQICADGSAELAAETEEQYGTEGPPTGQAAEEFALDVVVPNFQQQHDDIAALEPPEGEEDAVQAILDGLQSAIDGIESDPRGFVEAGGANEELDEAGQAAKDFGLNRCGG